MIGNRTFEEEGVDIEDILRVIYESN